jgi:hypothetical protein
MRSKHRKNMGNNVGSSSMDNYQISSINAIASSLQATFWFLVISAFIAFVLRKGLVHGQPIKQQVSADISNYCE